MIAVTLQESATSLPSIMDTWMAAHCIPTVFPSTKFSASKGDLLQLAYKRSENSYELCIYAHITYINQFLTKDASI